MRKFFTHPFSILIIGAVFFSLLVIASIFPDNSGVGKVIFAIGAAGLLLGVHLLLVMGLKHGRAFFFKLESGVPENITTDTQAIVGGFLHLTSAVLILCACLLSGI